MTTTQQAPARPHYATVEAWREEAIRRFGPDPLKWKFVCPACGHEAMLEDFKALDADPQRATFECIGRVLNELGWHDMVYTEIARVIDDYDEDDEPIYAPREGPARRESDLPCDWAAFGLLGTLNAGTRIDRDDGTETWAFDFADPGQEHAPA